MRTISIHCTIIKLNMAHDSFYILKIIHFLGFVLLICNSNSMCVVNEGNTHEISRSIRCKNREKKCVKENNYTR